MNAEALYGMVLGSCTLQKVIGQGGMGAVYLAQQSRPNRRVAVKVFLPLPTYQPYELASFLERFRRETDAIAVLQHPNIMPVHEYSEQDGFAYLVMPYIQGGTLRDELETEGRLPFTHVIMYLEQIADALDCAHAQGIIHRDIKPANIMITPEKRLLLTDFGLAKILVDATNEQKALSSPGTPMGTPDYMAPEQVIGGEITPYTDIYSLGILLYHMVTGEVPFKGKTPMKTALQHLHAPPSFPRAQRPDLPDAAEQVILRALAKHPEDRYPRASELASAFRLALETAGVAFGDVLPVDTHDDHTVGDRPRSLFDPVWRLDTQATSTRPYGSAGTTLIEPGTVLPATENDPDQSSLEDNIVARTRLSLISLTDIVTQDHLPAIPKNTGSVVAVVKPDPDPLSRASQQIEAILTEANQVHQDLLSTTTEQGENLQDLSTAVQQHTPLPSVRDMNNQQGPTQPDSQRQWPPAQNQGGSPAAPPSSILGPHARNGLKRNQPPGSLAWQQTNAAPQQRIENSPIGNFPTESSPSKQAPAWANPTPNNGGPASFLPPQISFNNGPANGNEGFAAPTMPFQQEQNNGAQFPNVPFGGNPSFAPPSPTGTLQPFGGQQSFGGQQPFSATQQPTNAMPGPRITGQLGNGNVTMQIYPSQTGALPNLNQTGTLSHPAGEYSGDTGMLKLNQAVKVIKVPVAGQPGQYMTGILPVQSRSGALPPPEPTAPPITYNSLKEQVTTHKKTSVITTAVVVLLVCVVIALIALHPGSSTPTSTARTTAPTLSANSQAAQATINASITPTVDPNSILMINSLNAQAPGWLVENDKTDKISFFFKNNAYHLRTEGKDIAEAVQSNLSLADYSSYSYTLTMQQIDGDQTSLNNWFGSIIDYNTVGKKTTFYAFQVVNDSDQRSYQFKKYDSSSASGWSSAIFQAKTGKEFKGGTAANTVQIAVNQSQFTFYVNGKKIGSAKDTSLKGGYVGMVVSKDGNDGSTPDETAFTNFLVTKS